MWSLTLSAAKYALVIGIGHYPQIDDGWWATSGDADVPLVCDILTANGFEKANIITLIDSQATYAGIIQAFEQLTERVSRNDTVYIHYSGHGQQITDTNGDEEDGFDEAWIPYDAASRYSDTYRGERHLLDDTLNKHLHAIRAKTGAGGKISVVADACYSGTSTRESGDNGVVRGTNPFIIPNVVSPKIAPYKVSWLTLTACKDNEVNRQVKIDGKYYGSLSYALYLLSDRIGDTPAADITIAVKELFDHRLQRSQSPQLEGPELMKLETLL